MTLHVLCYLLLQNVKERPKRKGPPDQLPMNTDEWSQYDAPDEAVESFKHSSMRNTGVNIHTVTKPVSDND